MSIPKTGLIHCCSTCGCTDVEALYSVHLNQFDQLWARRTAARWAKNDPELDITITLAELETVIGSECENDGLFWCPDCEDRGSICRVDLQTRRCDHCSSSKIVYDNYGTRIVIPEETVFHPDLKLHEYVPESER